MWGSDEAFRIYGLAPTPDRLLPLAVVQGIPLPEHRKALDDALAGLLSGASAYDLLFRIRRHDDGAIREVHSFAELVRDEAGKPLLVSGTIQDITEQEERARSMLEALRASEERARIAFEQAADAIFLGNATGDFVGVNARASTLTGYSREELLQMNMRNLFAPEVHRMNPLRYQRVLAGETVVNERTLTRKDGKRVPVEMRTTALSDGTLQAIIRDVSERRRLEDQLQLRQRMDSIGTLASGIAHDFNNVLAGIMGYADVLRIDAEGLRPVQRESVDAILQSCQRAADLVAGLLNLSRPGQVEPDGFDLHEVAAEVILVLRETTDRLVAKELQIPEGRFAVRGSASALYHALMNLGVNAIQAIEQKGAVPGDRLHFEAEEYVATAGDRLGLEPGRYVHLVVRDTGTGMSEEVRRRAFDPLFSTKEKGDRKGQGLGLAMVYNVVVRQHSGAIEVESVEGKGAAFHLYLPAGDRGPRGLAAEATTPASGTETVLVVDDEPLIAKLTRRILERVGYTVLTAADGAEAVDLFTRRGGDIAIVVLDRTLPKLRGEAVLARMRELRPEVKVIVSSGDASAGVAQFPGASAVLCKPYTPTRLCEVIRQVLDQPPPSEA
jgi:two-component system cell cycle sensor histidine kinase/response regulator CckA